MECHPKNSKPDFDHGAHGTDELLKTAILAAVGATVSFVVSLVLHRLRRPRR